MAQQYNIKHIDANFLRQAQERSLSQLAKRLTKRLISHKKRMFCPKRLYAPESHKR